MASASKGGTFYERHRRGLGYVEIVLTIGLAIVPSLATPSIISCVGGNPSTNDVVHCFIAGIYCLVYGIFFVYCRKGHEDALAKQSATVEKLEEADRLKHCFRDLLGGLSQLAEKNAAMANDGAHSIVESGSPKLPKRSFEQDCKSVCKLLRVALNRRYGEDILFEVSYDVRDEESDVIAITMAGANATNPGEVFSCLNRRRVITDSRPRFDIRLFRRYETGDTMSATILLTPEETAREFRSSRRRGAASPGNERDQKDYRQYVAIPVVCPAVEGESKQKVVGLLQIAVVGSSVWENRAATTEVIGYYMMPLANQLLLIHKLGKALRAAPSEKEGGSEVHG